MALITVEELHMFHRMERNLLLCLLCILGRDPTQSLLVMALWLWLEHVAHPNLIAKLHSLSHNLVNALANEAILCLHCLEHSDADDPIPAGGGLPLTATLAQMDISLHFFNRRRFTVIAGIKSILNNLCSRIFTDILSHVYGIAGTSTTWPGPPRPVMVPGFPHPLYGPFRSNREEWDLRDGRLWCKGRWRPSDDVTEDDKTMFLTFSRGFPVTEEEVAFLFRSAFGEKSVGQIYMGNFVEEEQAQQEQTLFATMVVDSVATVDRILNGKRIAKYRVNGKHIWARKYERRE